MIIFIIELIYYDNEKIIMIIIEDGNCGIKVKINSLGKLRNDMYN